MYAGFCSDSHVYCKYFWQEEIYKPLAVYYGGSELFMYGFTIKIKMLVLAKVLSIAFLKESVFTKSLFIYLLQQTEVFNSGSNMS